MAHADCAGNAPQSPVQRIESNIVSSLLVRLVVPALLASATAACNSTENDPDSAIDWEPVLYPTISESRCGNPPGTLAALLEASERSKQLRRRNGLALWDKAKDDVRRYDWLIASTHLAPRYPVDICAWAEAEAKLETADSGMAVEEMRSWRRHFEAMKADFLVDPRVDEADRRYLLYGEIVERIYEGTRSAIYKDTNAGHQIVEDVMAFAGAYPNRLSEEDRNPFEWQITSLIELVRKGDPPALPGRQYQFDNSLSLTVTPRREPPSTTPRSNHETNREFKSQSLGV